MITIEDCKAFCDAPSSQAEELACHECLTMLEAYARAHELAQRNDTPNPFERRAK
jgi:hypothetical protein